MAENDGQQQGQQEAQPGTAAPPADGNQGGGSAAAARPSWAPEKFWDAEKGELRSEQLAKSYGELEKQRGKLAENLKPTVRQEIEAELFGKRPAKPEEYPLAPQEDAVDVVIMAGPPGADFAPEPGKTYLPLNPDSKALGMLRQMAHRAGTSPEDFQALLVEVARENGQRVPTESDMQAEREKLWGQLGEHGQRRVQHLWGSLRTVLGDRANALDGLVSDAKAVEALEELAARATGSRFAPPAGGNGKPVGALTEDEIRAKMAKPEYWRDKDPALLAEVERDWKTLYPS
jgi:hypothetical protein